MSNETSKIRIRVAHPATPETSTFEVEALDWGVGPAGELIVTDTDYGSLVLASGYWAGYTTSTGIDLP